MAYPFPGMNPYIEQASVGQDFHQSLVIQLREMIESQISSAYIVKVEERLYVHEAPELPIAFLGRGDVLVADAGNASSSYASSALLAPVEGEISVPEDVIRHGYLEILDQEGRELITIIEVLRRSNKYAGADREQYIAKRQRVISSSSHLVEIDLLRGGPRLPVQGLPRCDYYAMVSRFEDRPQVGLWAANLRESLPEIPIPLKGDDRVSLNLQAAVERVYESSGYWKYIYQNSPEPQLSDADRQWAEGLLDAQGIPHA